MSDTEKIERKYCGFKNMDRELRQVINPELRCESCDGYANVRVINIDENLEYINFRTEICKDYLNYNGREV